MVVNSLGFLLASFVPEELKMLATRNTNRCRPPKKERKNSSKSLFFLAKRPRKEQSSKAENF